MEKKRGREIERERERERYGDEIKFPQSEESKERKSHSVSETIKGNLHLYARGGGG